MSKLGGIAIYYTELEARIKYLTNLIKEKEVELSNAPQGSLNVHLKSDYKKENTVCRYYLNHNGSRRYLKASEQDLVKRLGQKDYDAQVLISAKAERERLINLLENSKHERLPEGLYEQLHTERQKIVTPIRLSDQEFVRQWQQKEYKKKGFRDNMSELYTSKEERVRSKSEVLIANALAQNNVPYRYEEPLYLEPYGVIHPDFTVLNIRTRKEIYWEHLGKMDDMEYAKNALERILIYEKNGIFPGDKLVISHETLEHPINSRLIDAIICKYFK